MHSDDHVTVVGVVVRVAGRYGVAASWGVDPRPDVHHEPSTNIVAVASDPSSATAWDGLVGRRVSVHGRWRFGAVAEAWAAPPVDNDDPLPDWMGPSTEDGALARPQPDRLQIADVRAAEAPLWADGTLLWRLVTPTRVVVATHDAELASARLASVYGRPLEVIPSPWSRADYDLAGAFWRAAEDAGVLFSVGRGLTGAGHVTIHVGVTYLDEALAALLVDVPSGLLTVDPLVRPA